MQGTASLLFFVCICHMFVFNNGYIFVGLAGCRWTTWFAPVVETVLKQMKRLSTLQESFGINNALCKLFFTYIRRYYIPYMHIKIYFSNIFNSCIYF